MPTIAVVSGRMLQKARTETNATKPSATEKPSTITLDPPLLYRGIWLLTHGDGVIRGVAGVLVAAGVRVDVAVEFALGRGTIAADGGVVPGGRSTATATGEIIIRENFSVGCQSLRSKNKKQFAST